MVQPGEKVPIDGIVIEGNSTLNTSALTDLEMNSSDLDFLELAFSTSSRIFETVDSPKFFVVLIFRTPLMFMLPLMTSVPVPTSRGRLSRRKGNLEPPGLRREFPDGGRNSGSVRA